MFEKRVENKNNNYLLSKPQSRSIKHSVKIVMDIVY